MVTIKDIAKASGVSNSTVSKALNDSPLVKHVTKRKILEIAKNMNYRKNLQATQLVSGKTNLIGLVLQEVGNPLFAHLAGQINHALSQVGLQMIMTIAADGLELLERLKVEGVIYWGNIGVRSQVSNTILGSELPVLIVGDSSLPNVSCLQLDRGLAIKKAIQYLRSFGHQKIGLIGNTQEVKLKSYVEVLKELGMEFHDHYVLPSNTTWWGGYSSVLAYEMNADSPTAFIGVNNLVTQGALRALLERGLTVPTEISLIGYDDLPDMEHTEVPLTTVGPSLDRIAHVSADMMVQLIRGEQAPDNQWIEPAIYVRKSVGFCKTLMLP